MSCATMSRMPCVGCNGKDSLFVGFTCQDCGYVITFKPWTLPKHGRTPKGVAIYSTAEKRERKNQRRRERRAAGLE